MSRRKLGALMIVQKYGGIAMKDEATRRKCIEHIKTGIQEHGKVVIVVSAIGRKGDPYATDTLLSLSKAFDADKVARDLIASCGELIAAAVLSAELNSYKINTTVLHGKRAGILTAGEYGDAEIVHLDPSDINTHLQEMDCIIIPGFQGVNTKGNVMTLGRGGSDLTAVALAAAINASHTEFFKDVPGVMTSDPSLTNDTKKIDVLKLDEFLLHLNTPNPIIQKRAALYAKIKAMPLYIRGIAGTEDGTWIVP
ncbi:amino acid kinase family protein [Sporosarcina sp. FA9]|uniref:amino acid kinase family protein n=1 Tax=Sporosarcina sp. FA9 TaxID=3413030 RepID=UPI003F65FF62